MGVYKTILVGGAVIASVGVGAGLAWKYVLRRRYEEPRHEVLERLGAVEIRRYEPHLVAVTEVEGSRPEALREGFRRLAGYIFGGNRGRASIPMTAPVSERLERRGERIPMTTPVATARQGALRRVTFAMPASYTEETLPRPNDPRVHIEQVPERAVAVLRFSGLAREGTVRAKERRLEAALQREGLAPLGAPVLARYDPPWIPGFARRNEIQVDVAPGSQAPGAP